MRVERGKKGGTGGGTSRVVDFVAAWDAISPRLSGRDDEEVDKEMLLSALTLAIPRLQQIPWVGGGGGGRRRTSARWT